MDEIKHSLPVMERLKAAVTGIEKGYDNPFMADVLLAAMVHIADLERAVREATTQAQIDAANELERIAQAIGHAGINGFGNAVRSVAERLASQPVSTTQEQAMDAKNQTPSDAIRSEVPEAPLAINGWQPISTIPTDGTRVLLGYVHWLGDNWVCIGSHREWDKPPLSLSPLQNDVGQGFRDLPTHWMPLPPSP